MSLWRERYEPLEELGRGGQGRVLRAFDHQHDRTVALKVRPAGTEAGRKALLAEAGILLGLRPHEGLPLVRDDFFNEDEYVVVMDWVEGIDLGRVLTDRGDPGLPLDTVISYLEPVAEALDHLHAHEPPIVHGDVKPANLILTASGSVVLVDFGISGAGGYGSPGGSPGFRAPEIAAAIPAMPAADIYGFAATAYTLLTGRVLDGTRPDWEGLEPSLVAAVERVIRRGLATEPERRPGSASEFVQRLKAVRAVQLPTGVITFVLTDVEGSTALWDEHPDLMGAALERHDGLIAEIVEEAGGRLIKSKGEGDSTMSVFTRASDAVRAAIAVQRVVADEAWPDPIELRVRTSIHTGEAQLRAGDYYGGTVNRAARLRALADGGQIFVSQATAQLTIDALPEDATLVELGPRELKGLSRNETVFELVVEGLVRPSPRSDDRPITRPQAFEQRIGFLTRSDGVRIAFATIGDGPPLVKYGPWGHLELNWSNARARALYEGLASHRKLIVFDKHGTGLSDRNRTEFTVDADVQDLEAIADHLSLDTFDLLGCSGEGPAAIAYASRHPERVRRLILYGTYAYGPNVGTAEVRTRLLDLLRSHKGLGARAYADIFAAGDQEAAERYAVEAMQWATGEMTAELFGLVYRADVRDLLPTIAVPTLILHRRNDRAMPFDGGRDLAAAIPGARFVALDGRAHAPEWEDSERLVREVERFLSEPDPTTPARAVAEVEPQRMRVELPPMMSASSRFAFVGRERESEKLHELWSQSRTQTNIVLIAGEAGVGKSRLTTEFARSVRADGGLVLAGRCDEGLAVPYQPFVEALRWFVDATPDDELTEALGRWPAELVRIVPEIADRMPDLPSPLSSEPETERWRLFEAVGSWLAATSSRAQTLLVLDDLHWATAPTIQLLRHLTRPDAASNVMVMATYRDTEVEGDHPLSEAMPELRRNGAQTISLTGLGAEGVEAFLREAAGHDLDDGAQGLALAIAIHDATGGIPLFVGEVIRHLEETGGRGTDIDVPDLAKDVIARRLARLDDEVNGVLRVMAVAGEESDLAVVERASGRVDVLAAIEPAVAAGLVREEAAGRFRFAHALIRRSLYDDIGATRRAQLHVSIADALEHVHADDLDRYVATLTHHMLEGGDPRAGVYAARAGRQALERHANADALRYFTDALRSIEEFDEETKCDVLIGLGEAQRRGGDRAFRDTLLGAADRGERLLDGERVARAILAMSREWPEMTLDRRVVRFLERALDLLPPDDSPLRARTLANLALRLLMSEADHERREQLSDEALAMARRLGDRQTLGYVLGCRYSTIWMAGVMDPRCVAIIDELAPLARVSGDPQHHALLLGNGSALLLDRSDPDACDAAIEQLGTVVDQLSQPVWRWQHLSLQAMRALDAGRLDRAESLMESAFEIAQPVAHDALAWYAAQLSALRREQGRLEELVPLFEGVAGPTAPIARSMLARMFVELDRTTEARTLFATAAADDFTTVPHDGQWLVALTNWSYVCSRLGEAGSAETLRRMILPYADNVITSNATNDGPVSLYLGMLSATLGDTEKAERHLAQAVQTCELIRSVIWEVRAKQEWARTLMSKRTPDALRRARELLDESLERARAIELPATTARGEKLLSELPLPAALSPPSAFAFVGRASEFDALDRAWSAVASGERRVVLLAGEAGIGKSRLAAEFSRKVNKDALVLGGRCDEGLAVPYQPFVEALRWFADSTGDEELRASLGRWPGELIRLVPELGERVTDRPTPTPSDPETERWRLFEAVASWLSATSARRSLLLVLEDVHWATGGTVHLLRHVAKSDLPMRLLVVATYRDTDVDDEHPIAAAMADIARSGGATIALKGFDAKGVDEFVRAAAGHELDQAGRDLAAALSEATGGVPLFLGETLRHLVESGALRRVDGRWVSDVSSVADLDIPQTAREVLRARLSHLSPETMRLLTLAAVFGAQTSLDVLVEMSGLVRAAVMDALEEAIGAGIVAEAVDRGRPTYTFSHALVRKALGDELSLARRQQYHLAAAEALEHLGSTDISALADHYRSASQTEKAIEYSLLAAHAATGVFAYEDAIWHLEGVVSLMEQQGQNPVELARVLDQLGNLLFWTGFDRERGVRVREDAVALYEAAGEIVEAAKARSRLGGSLATLGGGPALDIRAALDHLRAAEVVLGDGRMTPSAGYMYVGLANALTRAMRPKEAIEATARALHIAETLENEKLRGHALDLHGWASWETGSPDEARRLMEESYASVSRSGDTFIRYIATWTRGNAAWFSLDPNDAIEWFTKELVSSWVEQAPGIRSILRTSWMDSLALAGRVSELRDAGETDVTSWVGWRSVLTDLGEPVSRLEELTDDEESSRDHLAREQDWGTWGQFIAVEACRSLDRRGAAERILEETIDLAAAGGSVAIEARARAELAIELADTGRAGEAQEHVRRAREILTSGGDWRGLIGTLRLAEGLAIACDDVALADSVDIFRRYGARWHEARALHLWGRAHLRVGDRTAGVAKIEESLGILRSVGYSERWIDLADADL